MIVREIQPLERSAYDAVVSHVLQSYQWGEFKESTGIDAIRLGWFENDRLIQGATLTIHPIPYTNYTVGYFPRGEVLDKVLVENVKTAVKTQNCIFIKCEPHTLKTQASDLAIKNLISQGMIVKSGKEIFSPHNFILSLKPSEEELLAKMHPKTRYNIRVAQKNNVVIEDATNESGLETFLKLQHETSLRQGFYVHPDSYYRSLFQTFNKEGNIKILVARYQSDPVTAWILLRFKDTLYYPYGASTDKYRNVMSNNLMMWETIRLGKSMGCTKFDMWGAAPPGSTPLHKWWGFTNFKEGYAPQRVEYVGSYDIVVNPVLYRPYLLADKLRWFFLSATARFRK